MFFAKTRHDLWIARALEEIIRAIYRPKPNNDNWYIDQVGLMALFDLAPPEIRVKIRFFDWPATSEYFGKVKLDADQD